jgi:hypothetical protein
MVAAVAAPVVVRRPAAKPGLLAGWADAVCSVVVAAKATPLAPTTPAASIALAALRYGAFFFLAIILFPLGSSFEILSH